VVIFILLYILIGGNLNFILLLIFSYLVWLIEEAIRLSENPWRNLAYSLAVLFVLFAPGEWMVIRIILFGALSYRCYESYIGLPKREAEEKERKAEKKRQEEEKRRQKEREEYQKEKEEKDAIERMYGVNRNRLIGFLKDRSRRYVPESEIEKGLRITDPGSIEYKALQQVFETLQRDYYQHYPYGEKRGFTKFSADFGELDKTHFGDEEALCRAEENYYNTTSYAKEFYAGLLAFRGRSGWRYCYMNIEYYQDLKKKIINSLDFFHEYSGKNNCRRSVEDISAELGIRGDCDLFYLQEIILKAEWGNYDFGYKEYKGGSWKSGIFLGRGERSDDESARGKRERVFEDATINRAKDFLRQSPLRLFEEGEIDRQFDVSRSLIMENEKKFKVPDEDTIRYHTLHDGYHIHEGYLSVLRKELKMPPAQRTEYLKGFAAEERRDGSYRYFYMDPDYLAETLRKLRGVLMKHRGKVFCYGDLAGMSELGIRNKTDEFYLKEAITAVDLTEGFKVEYIDYIWYCYKT
jgi:hypothetical protein